MKAITLLLGGIMLLFASCIKETDGTVPEVSGCTDVHAINYKPGATKDDGTCHYSNVTFYGSYGFYNGIPISSVSISANGSPIGALGVVYPGGPGNCSAPGTVSYTCQNGNRVDWNAAIQLANGAVLYSSGSFTPYNVDCIKVNVTR